MVLFSSTANHDQESVEKRIISEDYEKEKVSGLSRSFNNFLGRTLEKSYEKRSTIKEVCFCDLVASLH